MVNSSGLFLRLINQVTLHLVHYGVQGILDGGAVGEDQGRCDVMEGDENEGSFHDSWVRQGQGRCIVALIAEKKEVQINDSGTLVLFPDPAHLILDFQHRLQQ